MTTTVHTAPSTDVGSRVPGRAARRYLLPATGALGALATATGLSGVGDAPDPHDSTASMVAHFVAVHDDVLLASGFGVAGAVLLGAFLLGLARRLWRRGAHSAAVTTALGAVGVTGYLAGVHAVYTSLSAYVADASPEATQGLFVLTIMAVPLFGAAAAVALGAAAVGALQTRVLPTGWSVVTAGAAVLCAVAVFSQADSGWFYPDVQQQVVGNSVLLWTLVTAGVLAVRARRRSRSGGGAPEGVTGRR